jgi:transposase/predicted transcriptional regulator
MYALDRRKVAVRIYSILFSLRKTGKLLNVSHSSVSRWLKNPEQKVYTRRDNTKLLKSDMIVETIKATVASNPFTSLVDLRLLIKETLRIEVSKELIRVAIKRTGFSKKRARFYGEPKNLEQKTNEFIDQRDKYIANGFPFVSIDEASFGRSGAVVKGYSKRGSKLFIRKNTPRVTTVSALVCVSNQGLVSKSLVQGSFNTELFLQFVNNLNLVPNTVLLLDNVSFHHSKVVKEFARLNDLILLYTPPYSPWYNPIEFCFSIIKRHYYKHQQIEEAFDSLSQDHCNAFFRKSLNCGHLKI